MNKFLKSAIKILSKSDIPLHIKTITDLALSKGILETSGKTPSESMGAIIYTDIKNKGNKSYFIKVKPSYFKFNKLIYVDLDNNKLKKGEYTNEELELIFSLPPTKDNINKLAKVLNRTERAIEQQYQWAFLSDKMIEEKNKLHLTNWNIDMKCRKIAKKMGWIQTY